MTYPTPIGFPDEWEAFFERHPKWVEKFKLLHTTLTKIFIRECEMNNPADKVVFFLGRLCVEDFNEIFLLCGNGYGIGGLKILRGLYERTVTMGYIAKNPDKAEDFLSFHHIHKKKLLHHAETLFDINEYPGPDEIKITEENYLKVKDKYTEIICKKCQKKKTMLSWTKLGIPEMAKKVDLGPLILPGYIYPTLHSHSTPLSIMERLIEWPDGPPTFDESAQRGWSSRALIAAHNVIIRLLMIQNTYFELTLDDEIGERKKDFEEIWGDNEKS